jgi:hypothetical protein
MFFPFNKLCINENDAQFSTHLITCFSFPTLIIYAKKIDCAFIYMKKLSFFPEVITGGVGQG